MGGPAKTYPRKLAPQAKRAKRTIWTTTQPALFAPSYLDPPGGPAGGPAGMDPERGARTFWPPDVQEGSVLARYRGFRVVAHLVDDTSFTVRAERRDDGKSLGYVNANQTGAVMQVRSAYLHQAHGAQLGHGIGTRLYENAARLACARYEKPLASDSPYRRSVYSESFWSKQKARGRARCVLGTDENNLYDLDGARRGRRRHARRHLGMGPFTTTAYPEEPEEHIKCKGFYVLRCPAPASLTGARRERVRRCGR